MNKSISKAFLTVFIIIVFIGVSFAQSNCKSYHLKKCGGYGPPYKYSGQSKSANFAVGETSSFQMSTFGGFEYCVTLCADKQLKGIFFRIKEEASGSVLYDGQAEGDEYLEKQFYVEDSKKLLVEVVVPEPEGDKQDYDYKDLQGCVGVVVEYRKVGKKGFN